MKILSKKNVGKRRVFDLTIENQHNFVVKRCVVHNSGAQRFIRKFKPVNLRDIAIATSIYRPGPLAAKVDALYLKAKEDPEEARKKEHPAVWKCLESTHGCIAQGEKVLTEAGENPIENLCVGDKLPSYNTETCQVEEDEVVAHVFNGIKEILEIETDLGVIRLTEDHRVWTQRGWVEAGKLTLSDSILRVEGYNYLSGKETLEDELPKLSM